MKYETVKSFVLAILVGVSLLLTLGLWSFQPKGELLDTPPLYEVDIGGKEVSKKDIIEPKSIIFHNYNGHYGFSDPRDQQLLFQDIQSWIMYDFQLSDTAAPLKANHYVELIFPDELPMKIVPSLFNFNKEVFLPEWSFNRIAITFDTDMSSLVFHFFSSRGDKKATAHVNNKKKYVQLWNYATSLKGLSPYLMFEGSEPIYIPKSTKGMEQHSITVDNIDPKKLIPALFKDKSRVKRNFTRIGEVYYNDGQRAMRVEQNGRRIIFNNPLNTNYERMDPIDLLDTSMSNINEQKGWTGDYNLEEIDRTTNFVRYRMYYDGYPVFNNRDLTVIEQEWRNQELYQYKRPLFSLNNLPGTGGEQVELQSGQTVIDYLKDSSYELNNISDIELGYQLINQSSASYYVTLKPAWYMNYNGSWHQIDFNNFVPKKGGS